MAEKKRILIVGGLSAGPSAAAKARRENENAEIILFEKTGHLSYATCGIPYALSKTIAKRDKLLVLDANLLRDRFLIDVHLDEEVIDIDPAKKSLKTNVGDYNYDELIYAAGAAPIIPPLAEFQQSENWSTVRTLEDFDKMMKEEGLPATKKVAVLGGGLIGVEVAENLQKAGKEVTLIEGSAQVLPPWEEMFGRFTQGVLEAKGIRVLTGEFMKSVEVTEGRIKSLRVGDQKVMTDYLIMSIGIRPNTSLLTSKGAKAIGNGALIVDAYGKTSLDSVYAAGDCATMGNPLTGKDSWFPLGTHSNKAGRAAGSNAVGGDQTYRGGYGTAIVKVFDYTLARTGLNFKSAKDTAYKLDSILINAPSTPGYYPDSKNMILQVFFEKETDKVLGAEAFGEVGVDKRIDVLSTAVYAGLRVGDLANIDLAYAPPFSPAKDPVVVAGFVGENQVHGRVEQVLPTELNEVLDETHQLIDLRNPSELEKNGAIEGAINIPLDELRQRSKEIDNTKSPIVYCEKGLRGYLGARILMQHGFSGVKNLAGGHLIWRMGKYERTKISTYRTGF